MPWLQDPLPGDPQRAWQRRANTVLINPLHESTLDRAEEVEMEIMPPIKVSGAEMGGDDETKKAQVNHVNRHCSPVFLTFLPILVDSYFYLVVMTHLRHNILSIDDNIQLFLKTMAGPPDRAFLRSAAERFDCAVIARQYLEVAGLGTESRSSPQAA